MCKKILLWAISPKEVLRLLVCNWPHSVGQNHLFVKMLFNRNSVIQKWVRRFYTACKSEKSIPCQPSGRHVIPSGRLSVHCSIRPDDVPYHLDARQTKHHSSGQRGFPSEPSTVSRSFCSNLHPSRCLSNTSKRLSVFDQASNSFQVHIWKDCFNHLDDVDSRPDALLLKARIAIQIQPSGCLSAWSRRALNRWKLRVEDQPSGRPSPPGPDTPSLI
jgi:hypothetical protein